MMAFIPNKAVFVNGGTLRPKTSVEIECNGIEGLRVHCVIQIRNPEYGEDFLRLPLDPLPLKALKYARLDFYKVIEESLPRMATKEEWPSNLSIAQQAFTMATQALSINITKRRQGYQIEAFICFSPKRDYFFSCIDARLDGSSESFDPNLVKKFFHPR